MTRIALGIQYDGSSFSGWQSQPHRNTVQDRLEAALLQFAGEPLTVTVAGRTDTGVHALGQVVHLDTALTREPFSWVRGVNTFLPPSIVVQWATPVEDDFHARFTAIERMYYYALYTGPTRVPLLHGRAGYLMLPPDETLDCAAMAEAASYLLGEHDFSAFRAADCQAKSPVKTCYDVTIVPRGPWVFLRFRASAFLHHMVRNLMGCLVMIGRGRMPPDWMRTLLDGRNRSLAAPTFMADGLYLARVGYADGFVLPAPDLTASIFHGVFDACPAPASKSVA
jgi:tRNA pseudouridine38-40 synthase